MPVCETCEGEDYEEIDGFFYCTTCQTQSQVCFDRKFIKIIYIARFTMFLWRCTYIDTLYSLQL